MKTKLTRREVFTRRIPKYRRNPILFAKEVLNFTPDEWQRPVLNDLAEFPRVTVRSGQGVGKTGLEAVSVLWFLSCFPYARVVATAPTRQQLNDVLWSEISKWLDRSPILPEILTWTKTRVYVNGNDQRWFAVARTATKPENMQGFHEDYMLFIVDEASGVADPIIEAIKGTLSGKYNKLLMCGNPTKASGEFHDSYTADRDLFRCHKVSSLDSPRTNKENIQALIKKYGIDSNVVRVRVLGEPPKREDDVFIGIEQVEGAIDNDLDYLASNRITIGCDVARFGGDETVLVSNIGGVIEMGVSYIGQNLMRTVGEIVTLYRKLVDRFKDYTGKIYVTIDDTGLGGGVTDRLREVRQSEKLWRMVIVPVNFASAVPDKKAAAKFADISTYMWAIIRDMMDNKTIRLPDDDSMAAQFSTRKYHLTSNGKLQLEAKKDMKKRSLPSPDRADAIALSVYTPKEFTLSNLV